MRPSYPNLHSTAVHQLAHKTLTDCLAPKPYKLSVSAKDLISLLLLMATTCRTLFSACRRFSFSHETARKAVNANLPKDIHVLNKMLVDGLHAVLCFSRRDRQRHWTLAIDNHDVPYYGKVSTPHIVGGQKKEGTKYFFRYASAVIIHRHRRYTVGLLPLIKKPFPPHEIVAALLDQVRDRGLKIGGVVLDSGFDSGETFLLLQKRNLNYTVPLGRRGSGKKGRNSCFSWASGTIGTVEWVTEKSRKAVSTRALAWKAKGQEERKVYAFSGWGHKEAVAENRRAWLGRRRYRERFGIETSYRQKNQARAWTTSCNAGYRLLLEGMAHLMRQIWVRLTEQIARALRLKPTDWVKDLPLAALLESIADSIKATYTLPEPKLE
jgi:hypothetical protein